MNYLIIYYKYYVLSGLHLPLGWFASSAWVRLYGKFPILGLPASGSLTLNFKLWKSRTLRRIIKFHGELICSIFHCSRIQKVFLFIIIGPAGNVLDPENQ